MSYRPIIAYFAIVCFTAVNVVNLSQPNWQAASPSPEKNYPATESAFPITQNLFLSAFETLANIGVYPPAMQPAVQGEFLPVEAIYPTYPTSFVQQTFSQPAYIETLRFNQQGTFMTPAAQNQITQFQPITNYNSNQSSHPAMQVQNYNLLQFRRMMRNHPGAQAHEIQGAWRGINKGVATLAIDEQFVKHFTNVNGQPYGDNISVHQVPLNQVFQNGWQPKFDQSTGTVKRGGKFQVQQAKGIGPFRHGLILSYRAGGNPRRDPSKLIEDRLVKLDDNHMLGRATAKFGPFRIPLAYFVLERVQ